MILAWSDLVCVDQDRLWVVIKENQNGLSKIQTETRLEQCTGRQRETERDSWKHKERKYSRQNSLASCFCLFACSYMQYPALAHSPVIKGQEVMSEKGMGSANKERAFISSGVYNNNDDDDDSNSWDDSWHWKLCYRQLHQKLNWRKTKTHINICSTDIFVVTFFHTPYIDLFIYYYFLTQCIFTHVRKPGRLLEYIM